VTTASGIDHKALAAVDRYKSVLAQIVTPAMIAEIMKEVFEDAPPADRAALEERIRIVTTTLCLAVPLMREAFEKPWDASVSSWPVP
jgi:hypothetical protein